MSLWSDIRCMIGIHRWKVSESSPYKDKLDWDTYAYRICTVCQTRQVLSWHDVAWCNPEPVWMDYNKWKRSRHQ